MPAYLDHEDAAEGCAAPVALRRARPFRRLRAFGQLTGAVAAIGVLSLFAREAVVSRGSDRGPAPFVAPAGFVPSAAVAARPAVPMAASRFRLDDPDALDPVRAEPARFNPASGQREDTLTQGTFEAIEVPYLRLTITDGTPPAPVPSLFVTLARRAADGQGLSVLRTGERGRIDSKFGAVETLEATLSGVGNRVCTGFATVDPSPIRLDGWLCAPLGQPPEPRAIVCVLDKLSLNGQAYPTLDAAFEVADARRDAGCTARNRVESAREAGAETGSLARRHPRKNEAKLRRTAQARP